MTVPCIIIDVDGTVADNEHRAHLIQSDPPDWGTFSAPDRVILDAPIAPMIDLVRTLRQDAIVIALTGRQRALYHTTWEWFRQHRVAVAYLVMRPDNDYRPAPEFKLEAVRDLWDRGWRPTLFIDDHQATLDVIAPEFPSVQCLRKM